MSTRLAEDIYALLAGLMENLRANETLTSELQRAEREFFPIEGKVGEGDDLGHVRFAEWYLLERESEVLGGIPVDCLQLDEAERDPLTDSLVGAFQVAGSEADEYRIEDLQDGKIHDLSAIEGVELRLGDVVIGRLYLGTLDMYTGSIALACQRDAGALADALRRDLKTLSLDRRLSQAEIEHLMFRGRGAPPVELPTGIPLERLEADLESCLHKGGIEEGTLSATAVSAALKAADSPGEVIGPLMDRIAFDSDVDLQRAQMLLLQMFAHHHREGASDAPVPEPPTPPLEQVVPTPSPEPEPPTPVPPSEGPLGADVARRIERGLKDKEDMAEVFADVDRMVGADEAVEDATPLEADGGDGDLRPLVTEFLWETEGSPDDASVLEGFIRTQDEAAVPHLDVESISASDLMRVLLQTYLESAPGQRAQSVARVYAVLERFYRWTQDTQGLDVLDTITEVNASLVQEMARLEAASLALSGGAETDDANGRCLLRVVQVHNASIEVARDETDHVVRVEVGTDCAKNLREDDLLLGSIREDGGNGSFAGMVLVMPAAVAGLLG